MNVFKQELYALISSSENEEKRETCMISNRVLTEDNSIRLYCGHRFVYASLFEEVKQQKKVKKKNNLFGRDLLRSNEIKCPYCRNVQKGILPPKEGFTEVMYVNTPLKHAMYTHKCENVFRSGKNKGNRCNKNAREPLCSKCKRNKNNKDKDKDNVQYKRCMVTMKSGKRKGLPCNRYCKVENETCGIHKKRLKHNNSNE